MNASADIARPAPWWAVAQTVVEGLRLRLHPRAAKGRLGERRGFGTGNAMEFHDFRAYQPGDDLRQVDWNAVARTGEWIVRTREAEVVPVVEVMVDTSHSMAIDPVKSIRTQEMVALFYLAAGAAGAHSRLVVLSDQPAPPSSGRELETALNHLTFNGKAPLNDTVNHSTSRQSCGLRLLISDFLCEAPPAGLVNRLRQNCTDLVLIELLCEQELAPSFQHPARLVDCESNASLETGVHGRAHQNYLSRLETHRGLWRTSATVAGCLMLGVSSADSLSAMASTTLASLFDRT